MILIIDDDNAIRGSLSFILKHAHYTAQSAASPIEAVEVVKSMIPELIIMDMNYTLATDGEEGLTLLKQIKVLAPDVPIILMTAWGSIQLAVRGMQAGAFDFITKPWNNAVLMQHIETALQLNKSSDSIHNATENIPAFNRSNIIGKSPQLTEVLDTVKRIARTEASVLITGESGTGKELIAEAIHLNSSRAQNPFVKVNLGGISQTLFESEMFGHKRGAFTDAISDRIGRFEMANGGTIFLDEIGELDLSCQVKLLRVLQEQMFERLGESSPRRVDVRIVCATNVDLKKMIKERRFREDLFYRINLITIQLPPLRERREDIPLLTKYFIEEQCKLNHLSPVQCTDAAIDFLCKLSYPGNIRELKNLIDRTLLICYKKILDAADFESQYNETADKELLIPPKVTTLDEIERQTILRMIEKHSGNLQQTARALGISRQALYRRLEKYHIKSEE